MGEITNLKITAKCEIDGKECGKTISVSIEEVETAYNQLGPGTKNIKGLLRSILFTQGDCVKNAKRRLTLNIGK